MARWGRESTKNKVKLLISKDLQSSQGDKTNEEKLTFIIQGCIEYSQANGTENKDYSIQH